MYVNLSTVTFCPHQVIASNHKTPISIDESQLMYLVPLAISLYLAAEQVGEERRFMCGITGGPGSIHRDPRPFDSEVGVNLCSLSCYSSRCGVLRYSIADHLNLFKF